MNHIPINKIESATKNAVKQYLRVAVSLLLTIFSCPIQFANEIGPGTDGSWMWAVNNALHEGFVFGRDFVFTYGPLGFLSTRNTAYVGNELLLTGDIMVAAGIFYIVYEYFSVSKKWWLVIFVAIICMRYAQYSQVLFILFIVYTSINILHKNSSYFATVFCALYGVLLFFVKINYGLISLALILITSIVSSTSNKKKAVVLLVCASLFFTTIYFLVAIDIIGYVRHSIPLITGYDEAMYYSINPVKLPYRSAMYFMLILAVVLTFYYINLFKTKTLNLASISALLFTLMACLLLYKNGFTRYDAIHYLQFFAIFPFFFIAIVFITGHHDSIVFRLVAYSMVMLSFLNYSEPDANLFSLSKSHFINWLSPKNYYQGIFSKTQPHEHTELIFNKEKLKHIGSGKVDIFPNELHYIPVNKLNYYPRPVPQSYSVYTGSLDLLNAHHFAKTNRPEFVLINNDGFDDYYFNWYESITKATIHLNYEYETLMSEADTLSPGDTRTFMLLRSIRGIGKLPEFEQTCEQVSHLGDTILIPGDTAYPIYLTADVNYTAEGMINKLVFQPMKVWVRLLTEDSQVHEHRLILPLMRSPVMVSKLVETNSELKNFLAGNQHLNKNIKAIIISTHNQGISKDINLSFFRFKNYRSTNFTGISPKEH